MYTCTHCDAQHLKWSGRCGECQKWGTLAEGGDDERASGLVRARVGDATPAELVKLSDAASESLVCRASGISEVDRVLGDGCVAGQIVLLSGEPGIGKSTLVAHISGAFAPHGSVLYVAGEESPAQLAARFARLAISAAHVNIVRETAVERVVAAIRVHAPALVVVDSIQSMTSLEYDTAAGAPTLLRAACAQLVAVAKDTGVPVFIVGQVTKDGTIAGPKMLEHMVDTVLEFRGDRRGQYRLLRATKHRFGGTDEVGVFEMTARGLIGVSNPSDLFLDEQVSSSGSAVTCTMEGERAFLVEVQALVNPSSYGTPVRRGSGFASNRLQMLLAILEKHGKISFQGQDVYVNVVGGMSLREPSTDLAVCAALVSSRRDTPVPTKTVLFGEVGLGGEVRQSPQAARRAKEAKRLGYTRVLSHKEVPSVSALVGQFSQYPTVVLPPIAV